MRAHVLLILLNKLGKRDKMRGLPRSETLNSNHSIPKSKALSTEPLRVACIRQARGPTFRLGLHLHPYYMYISNEGSCKSAPLCKVS